MGMKAKAGYANHFGKHNHQMTENTLGILINHMGKAVS